MERITELNTAKDGSESVSDDSVTESRVSSHRSSSDHSSLAQLGLPIGNATNCLKDDVSEENRKPHLNGENVDDDSKMKKQGSIISEMEMMKERFAKLLLGEDMSGSGKGACTALAISNAITNLCAAVFGQLWRLEPLSSEKKSMWQREMEWILSVSDHIVEMIPAWQTGPDGNRVEVMTSQPRSDLFINLPALRKLDNMLIEILDGFTDKEFWYVDQGIAAPESDGSVSLQKAIQRQDDKWWLPVPRVPLGGLPEATRKKLSHKLDCANQIFKAATSINSVALAEMEVPDYYLETLPKNGRACLGDIIHRYITSEHFSSECLLDCLDLSSDRAALEIANRVEAAIYIWRGTQHPIPTLHPNHGAAKLSWEMVKDLMVHADKRGLLAERAENLLLLLKQRYPGLTQTNLDATKIQFNKDIGKSILESYSRVLECLAFNIAARIKDILYVDDINKQSDKVSSVPTVSLISHKKIAIPFSMPISGTPYKTSKISPCSLLSPSKGEVTQLLKNNCNKIGCHGLGVKSP